MTWSRRNRWLALGIAALAVVAAVGPVAAEQSRDATASTPSPPAGAPPTPPAVPAGATARDVPRFLDAPYRDHRGDVVRIPVAVPFHDAATVTVRGNDTGFGATVTVRDGNLDGLVTLVWNTYAPGVGGTFRVAAPADAVTDRTAGNGTPAAGTYRLVATSPATNATGVATVTLTPAGPVNASVLRGAPALSGDLTDADAVAAVRGTADLSAAFPGERGHLVVTPAEVFVVDLRVPGLAGALAAADGPNATARFRSLLGGALSVAVTEDAATVSSEEDPFAFRLRDVADYRVVPDPANDTYYVVLGPGAHALPGGPDALGSPDVERGDVVHLDVAASVARGAPAVRNLTVEFVAGGTVRLDATRDGDLPPAAANGTVAGWTTLRPGERVTVGLESAVGDPFPVAHTVAVGPDGRFEATVDLSGVPAGTSFEAVVRHDGRTADAASGVVGPVARVRLADRRVPVDDLASRLHVDALYTTAGGFVAVRRGAADGPLVGVTPYTPPGRFYDVDVRLRRRVAGDATLVAVVHRDADGDRRFDAGVDPVYVAGAPTDAARFVAVGGTPTAIVAPSATPSPTAAGTSTGTSAGHDDVPGFGPAVAVVALAAAVVAARSGRLCEGGGDE